MICGSNIEEITGLVRLDKDQVMAACKARLRKIHRRRHEEKLAVVEAMRTSGRARRYRWWRKKDPSYRTLVSWCLEPVAGRFSTREWDWAEMTGGNTLSLCHTLMKACKSSNSNSMHLNVDVWSRIS